MHSLLTPTRSPSVDEAGRPTEGQRLVPQNGGVEPLPPQTLTLLLGLLTEGLLPLLFRQRTDLVDEGVAIRGLLNGKLAEVVVLVLRASAPAEEAIYALAALNQKLNASFDLLHGERSPPWPVHQTEDWEL